MILKIIIKGKNIRKHKIIWLGKPNNNLFYMSPVPRNFKKYQ
jgi:hypothetical protein